jgi:hypothetical protein
MIDIAVTYYKQCAVLLQDATNASIPNYEYMAVRDFFKVIPGCSYKFVVESNPHDGKKNATLMYTVPGKVNSSVASVRERTIPTERQVRSILEYTLTSFWVCSQSQQFVFPYSPIHITTCFGLYRPSSGEIYTVVFKAIMTTMDPL